MTQRFTSRPLVRRLLRALAAIVAIAASVATILSAASDYGGSGLSPLPWARGAEIAWVAIAPTGEAMSSLGDTVRFAVTITDKQGVVVPAPITWTTDDPGIASVSEDGHVVARGPGITTITAAAGGRAARARVIVRQVIERAHVLPDSVVRLAEDAQLRLDVRALDARGFTVAGRGAEWQSADTSVATVDSLGVVTARNAGQTTLTATIDGVEAESPITVLPVPGSVTLVGDGELHAPAGRPLGRRVAVHLTSKRGRPAAGLVVRFTPLFAHGRVDADSAKTDAGGNASTAWTLGTAPGRQMLRVTIDGLDTVLVAMAEAEPIAANTRYVGPATEPTGRADEPLPQPVTVRLTDTLGRALADVPVSWSVEGGGSIVAVDARTDTLGEARATWTLGPKSGRQRARIQAGSARGIPPFHVIASATAGVPATVTVVSGDAQRARVGDALAKRIVVRVRDAAGNPVIGARVMAMAAAGSTSDTLLTSDSTGTVSVRWTLGPVAGVQQLHVRPEG
ncbi:MAG TPA: Ig-like domain-containing protein, partial [Gemmatimonadaceae bacterium]|nr:Ig-like domain-containing protein [Gemmatimonadaceae bacterium]